MKDRKDLTLIRAGKNPKSDCLGQVYFDVGQVNIEILSLVVL